MKKYLLNGAASQYCLEKLSVRSTKDNGRMAFERSCLRRDATFSYLSPCHAVAQTHQIHYEAVDAR